MKTGDQEISQKRLGPLPPDGADATSLYGCKKGEISARRTLNLIQRLHIWLWKSLGHKLLQAMKVFGKVACRMAYSSTSPQMDPASTSIQPTSA